MKKRTPHNKSKSRITYLGGKHAFISRRERYSPLVILGITMCLSIASAYYGQYASAKQLSAEIVEEHMVSPYVSSILYDVDLSEVEHKEDKSEKLKIIEYIVEVFGENSAEAITIIKKCENSKFNPKATNWNRNGTWDTGIFQINQVHGYTMEEMQDYRKNIDAAKKIFDSRGWTAWSCSHVVGVKPFYLK